MKLKTLPKLFHLKRHDELLAILESCGPSGEMFWITCTFKPTELFSEVETLLRDANTGEDMEQRDSSHEKLIQQGVRLLDVENNVEITYFFMHVRGDSVEIRIDLSAYDE